MDVAQPPLEGFTQPTDSDVHVIKRDPHPESEMYPESQLRLCLAPCGRVRFTWQMNWHSSWVPLPVSLLGVSCFFPSEQQPPSPSDPCCACTHSYCGHLSRECLSEHPREDVCSAATLWSCLYFLVQPQSLQYCHSCAIP